MRVYLSGEIHTNWRQEIISGSQGLNVIFDGPITDHELSDDCGVMIMGNEPDKFWHDNKGAKLNAIRTRKGLMDADIVVVRFGEKYKQWNAAFDAGFAAANGKSLIVMHGKEHQHALKEVDAAALAVVTVLGPRKGKYNYDGSVNPMPGSNIPMAALGAWILWLGWFGFNGGSELKVSEVSSATAVSQVFLNTNMAAAGGVVAALLLSLALTGKMDVTMAINGAIAGLVSITADPLSPSGGTSVIVGAIGGIIVYFSILFLEKRGIDDPVGAISAHGIVGIYGVLVVSLTGGADFLGQLTGVVMIAAFTYVASYGVVKLINMVMPIRATDEEQDAGLDVSEIGIEAYPEFK